MNEPIISLATPVGKGIPIAIFRASGKNILENALKFIQIKFNQKIKTKYFYRCLVHENGKKIDDGLMVYFQSPHSYTGEDIIEIHSHGSPFVTQKILQLFLSHGFRVARPGEYTERAFINGKMDLTEAEGISDLIFSQTHSQWQAARQLADGRLSKEIESLREILIEAMAHLEALIDFPEEKDIERTELEKVYEKVSLIKNQILKLAQSYNRGKIAKSGFAVGFWGKPNSGKSTLFNQLLKKERSIVSQIPGTTRDYIEEQTIIQGTLFRFYDLAGIRDTHEPIEKMGIELAKKIVTSEIDLLLILCPANSDKDEFHELKKNIPPNVKANVLEVITKSDLIKEKKTWYQNMIQVSCFRESEIHHLEKILCEQVDHKIKNFSEEETMISSLRHLNCLNKALASIDRFMEAFQEKNYEECLAFELQDAIKNLSEIIGQVDHENILDKIFSTFCVGK